MIECGSLEYAQARLQARHGQRADEAAWQRLETAREFAALLDAVRSSPLRGWVVGLTSHSRAHEIEAGLRAHWRSTVAEVAGWMPAAWRPALAWCALLPLLPALQHLARGGAVAPWMAQEPLLRPLCAAPPAERAEALGSTAGAALARAWPAPQSLGRMWQQEWQRRLPRPLFGAGGGRDDRLQALVATVQAYWGAAAPGDAAAAAGAARQAHGRAGAAAPAAQGTLLRRALKERLVRCLRRAVAEPAAAFAHLALCALDLERLRAELLGRALFPPPQEAA